MARLLTIDACTVSLRNALLRSLRSEDEGMLLPQATQSSESGVFKNCVFRLCGDTPGLNAAVFGSDLFTGISLVQLKEHDCKFIESVLEDDSKRKEMLKNLVDAMPSEVSDPELQVGPSLDCDELGCDLQDTDWKYGFDSPSCFIGIFSAEHSKTPEVGKLGISRVHKEYFLVCKAGAGVCASTFHSRLRTELGKGLSLDAIFSDAGVSLGSKSIRRLSSASARNRHRMMLAAKDAMGLNFVESIGDQASRNKHRGAVVEVDVMVNSLRKLEESCRVSTWQYCSAVDGVMSKGIVSLSNAAEGLVLFLQASGEKKIALKNETWSSVPCSTKRLATGRELVGIIKEANGEHCDKKWLLKRFGWKNREFTEDSKNVLPFSLWGSHQSEVFTKTFARELGVSNLTIVRLRPELVCIGGVESGKLRAL